MRDRQTDEFDKKVDELRTKIKGLDQLKVRDDVFDEYTLLGLYKLLSKGCRRGSPPRGASST